MGEVIGRLQGVTSHCGVDIIDHIIVSPSSSPFLDGMRGTPDRLVSPLKIYLIAPHRLFLVRVSSDRLWKPISDPAHGLLFRELDRLVGMGDEDRVSVRESLVIHGDVLKVMRPLLLLQRPLLRPDSRALRYLSQTEGVVFREL